MIVELELRTWDESWLVVASRQKDDKTGAQCICAQFTSNKFDPYDDISLPVMVPNLYPILRNEPIDA